ncbi:cellulase family glycosylhydrolase [Lacibacter sediminis]|uniref:Cellulase family glycosylhydrolase n=2 Tax=Lacibacter sediminis TaxID=2760713 RepID=A0A7G5XMK6_9BACT|nr:cellulase family glycosylhydrolase [Lacibacter sediminis]
MILLSCKKKSSGPAPVVVTPPVVTPIPPINTNSTTAKEIIEDMAAGFNLGNTFENGINSSSPATNKQIIDLYYSAGMRHVRIPITWVQGFSSNLADANGNVNVSHPRLLELKEIVDYALAKKMYVVINTHHEHWLKDNYDGSAAFDTKFATLWNGIATFFKDYPKQLLFEVLNEPEGAMGQWSGTGYPLPTNAQAIDYTRKINKVGYDAIRATGGNNITRLVMVSPNGQGNQGMIEEVYPTKASLPGAGNDAYLAIQVHTYDPWAFCGQTGSNAAWPGSASIENAIKKVGVHSKLIDVPINYGEFGVGRQSNTGERNTDLVRGYYKLFRVTCKAEKMSFTPWDDRGWFGLIYKSGTDYLFSNNIVPSMMQ